MQPLSDDRLAEAKSDLESLLAEWYGDDYRDWID